MARKKKTTPKTPKRRKASRSKSPPALSLPGIAPFIPAVLAAVTVLLLLGGAAMLTTKLADRASDRRIQPQANIIIHWPTETGTTSQPQETWVPLDQQLEILELIQSNLLADPNPLSIAGLMSAAQALERSGWFEGIPTLRRRPDSSVEVTGIWRIPRAWIRFEATDYLVDGQGRLMPLVHSIDQPVPPRTPVINPGTRPPMTPAGQADYARRWASATVWSAIELLDLLRAQPYWDQVASVDAGGLASDASLVIVTDRNSRIIWGAGPSQFQPGERPTKEKLYHLATFNAEEEFGRHIDAGMGGYDLRSGYIVLDRTITHVNQER